MKVLILGGTKFVGRHIVEALLAGGHSVGVLTRGKTPDDLPPRVERLRGDRDEGAAGLTALKGRSWDACVDVSGYIPRQVRPSAEALRGIVSRYVFISTGSVYGDAKQRPVTEENPTMPPAAEDVTVIDGDTYGPLKVTCENIVRDIYEAKATILRPQIVAGPHDPSGRFTYWVKRASLGGTMLAPGDGTDHVQVIDGRDLARFARKTLEEGITGTFNMAGHRVTWAEFMAILAPKDPVWVPKDILEDVDSAELPLYRPEHGAYAGLMDVDNAKALAAGLRLSGLAVTVKDTRDWLAGVDLPLPLTPAKEKELILKARR
ncbi:MAG: NAD-dependent epimerase/dehydratase family protein [Elusimicrobia bacterium]|nr:NAD-dependent epimerase/dehydratase family protein [Elusimicrobiota bacterium]